MKDTITAAIALEEERMDLAERLFDLHFPLAIEPAIYHFAGHLSERYHGGYWHFFTLSNGGFYMAPDQEVPFPVVCENGYEGTLSPDAFGITCCLYAFSNLSFHRDERLSQLCAEHFHWLREYMLGHPEVGGILAATD